MKFDASQVILWVRGNDLGNGHYELKFGPQMVGGDYFPDFPRRWEIKYTYKCECCKKKYNSWATPAEEWLKLPRMMWLENKMFCVPCFRELCGSSYFWKDDEVDRVKWMAVLEKDRERWVKLAEERFNRLNNEPWWKQVIDWLT